MKKYKFLMVCDVDSQLVATRSIACQLHDRGHEVVFAIDKDAQLPPSLLEKHCQEFSTVYISVENIPGAEWTTDFFAIGVYLTGSRILNFRILMERHLGSYQHNRPRIFCGFNGVVFEKFEEGIAWRLGYDVICLNGPKDYNLFISMVKGTKYENQPTAIVGLNRTPAKHNPRELTVDRVDIPSRKIFLFAEQVSVPSAEKERLALLSILSNLAQRNPEWDVVIKPRVRPGERTFHKIKKHISDHLKLLHKKPANLKVHYDDLGNILPISQIFSTISSTALFEALSSNVPAFIASDFGIRNDLGTNFFFGSGLLTKLQDISDLNTFRAPEASKDWLHQIGFSQSFSTDSLLSALQDNDNSKELPSAFYIRESHSPEGIYKSLEHDKITQSNLPSIYHVELSYKLLRNGNLPEAGEILLNLLDNHPFNTQLLRLLAEVRIKERKWKEASELLDIASDIGPKNRNLAKRAKAIKSPFRQFLLRMTTEYNP